MLFSNSERDESPRVALAERRRAASVVWCSARRNQPIRYADHASLANDPDRESRGQLVGSAISGHVVSERGDYGGGGVRKVQNEAKIEKAIKSLPAIS